VYTESPYEETIFTCAPEIFGLLRIPVIHMNKAMTVPTANCTVVMFIGYGRAFKTCGP
jgi:hypothetical protein